MLCQLRIPKRDVAPRMVLPVRPLASASGELVDDAGSAVAAAAAAGAVVVVVVVMMVMAEFRLLLLVLLVLLLLLLLLLLLSPRNGSNSEARERRFFSRSGSGILCMCVYNYHALGLVEKGAQYSECLLFFGFTHTERRRKEILVC